ncbi:nucleotide-binding oligomerization domain-containing protein 1-like isoform X1 [Vombatus ursinus]|uniref:Nucleotide binding oligomerization domain containing 1 n=1 Tax=Vombatus ursinus TaxID=29139 RepID=A0A4X2M7C3_VOMUR|nr:nucleotide-binding oligomerization domain-containing protein 1-like isoform X1 [Vombatus ursinus]XP_027728067.1 nucleotide-binding oligomerization domain-containing protein 1-like isoform X1 [Vombatus ursinus]XP_027728068.1 nucleotide-binding oligomerization domain-containing protein 1-like isoform X1 [Vombatus ursinus]XP_027728069.1 nucleotide-binding oligomerization domain-containing protein 1-like isoform X1 [Vombatus ursinus]XP_027728080.1 nucleotide-binding oligomerization domain-contai
MEIQALPEVTAVPQDARSCIRLLKADRERLVTHIRNVQCLTDNLLANEYFSVEDAEIVGACPTLPDKVRKMLDLVQSKGEEVCEYLISVLQQIPDAFVDLQPWLEEICFSPSELVRGRTIVNTDPVSRYTQKLRSEWGRDSKFLTSYSQKEEMLLADTYTENIMELLDFRNESLGSVSSLGSLLDDPAGVINREGETVFVFGDAGVGKSVLLQKMQSLWAREELGRAKFFFPFRCRTFSCFPPRAALSLRDLLFTHSCCPELEPDAVFAFLLRFPQSVLFTFDGFDELHSDFDLSQVPDAASPLQPAHPLALLASLLRGKLLPGAGKVLTSRTGVEVPRALIRKKVQLRGFSPSHLRAYTCKFFPDRALQVRVLNQLDASPNLCSLCSVPLFCWIIFRCFQHFHGTHEGAHHLPDRTLTLTDVFLLMAEAHLNRALPTSLLQRNTRSQVETFRSGRETLCALGRLAYWGMLKNLFVFSQEEVEASDVQEGDLQLGFVRAVPEPGPVGDQLAYEFFHITLQSFFTALFLVADDKVSTRELLKFFGEWTPRGQRAASIPLPLLRLSCLGGSNLDKEDPFRNNDHFQFTNLFLCGLLSKAKQRLVRHLVPVEALRKKRRALWRHLFASLRSYLKSLPRTHTGEFNQVQAMPTFIWMLRCIYETQSQKVGRLAARGICANYIKLTYCNACSADCSAISFVLHHFPKQLALDLDNNNLNDYGVKELRPCFSRLTVLRLSVNQITDSGVKVLCEELTKYKILTFLGLYNNQITNIGAKYVAKMLEECTNLTHLKLGANYITSEGGKCLALAIKKSKSILDIGMWGNKIGDEGAKAFADALRNHPSLSTLSLAFNGISTEGGKSLAQALQQNSSLKIVWLTKNDLDDEVAESLAEMLEVNQTLRDLWLIQNQITAKGISRLADALQKNSTILDICLSGNPIKPEEARVFQGEKRFHF